MGISTLFINSVYGDRYKFIPAFLVPRSVVQISLVEASLSVHGDYSFPPGHALCYPVHPVMNR